jgi:hypothetical protein
MDKKNFAYVIPRTTPDNFIDFVWLPSERHFQQVRTDKPSSSSVM